MSPSRCFSFLSASGETRFHIEEAEIVARNAGYDIQDSWETPIGDYTRSRRTAPYIRIDEVYRELDILAA